jgi:Pyridoxamine 5'-phosphate oxidase
MHEIVAANRFMTLATADLRGQPWATPVWYAPDGDDALLWLSRPDTRHSRNVAERPQLAIVIFDSSADPDDAAAVYFEAVASQAPDRVGVYSARSTGQGLREFTSEDVTAPGPFRLYRAEIVSAWELGPGDQRLPLV